MASQLCQEKLSKQKLECNLQKLQQELTDARSQLNTRIAQLEEVKAVGVESQRIAVLEMQKRFAVIDTALGVSLIKFSLFFLFFTLLLNLNLVFFV